MDLGLSGRRVIVGGASRGIGLAVARAFLAEGAHVALLARQRVVDRPVDLRDGAATVDAVQDAASELGGLDCAVANAGSGAGIAEWDAPAEEWARLLDENLTTTVNLCRAAARTISDGGALALIASIAGLRHLPAPLPYGAAKAAVVRYGKDLAHALAGRGVRVNVVAPGNVLFPGGRWEELRAADPHGVEDYVKRAVPLARFGSPAEIADAVVFLCSDRSGFITGACLAVDGGQLGD